MNTHNNNNLRQTAKKLSTEKNYEQALPVFKTLFDTEQNIYDGINYAFCLLRQKQYNDALEICRILYLKNRKSENIANLYAQAIFSSQIIAENPDKNTFLKAAKAVIKLCNPQQKYSPYVRTVLKTLDFLKTQNPDKLDLRIYWAEKLNADILETKIIEIKNPITGKTVKLPSQLEKWALHKAQILSKLQHYNKLAIFLDQILQHKHIQNSKYQIWLLRIKAIMLSQTDKIYETEQIYSKIYLQKPEWFIACEYAEILNKTNNPLKALQILLKINLEKQPEFAVIKTINILQKTAKNILPSQILQQSEQISAKAKQLQHSEKKSDGNAKHEFYKELQNYWQNIRKNYIEKKISVGTIIKILNTEKAGFIKAENGQSVYFEHKNCKIKLNEIIVGQKVKFEIAESFDKKKQQKSIKAIEIYKIND